MRRASGRGAALLTAGLAVGAGLACYRVLRRRPPGGRASWERVNHRGEPVSLLEGPAVAAGAAAAAVLGPGLPGRARAAQAVAAAGAAGFGGYDDFAGSGDRRGFRGHLGALAAGEVTTGAVKLAGLGGTGLAAAALLGGGPLDLAVNAALVAGGANLVNLFDLRPGRAIKVTLAISGLLALGSPAAVPAVAAPAGAALALLPEDLAERAMLGDAGANALGAMLGTAAAAGLPRPARLTVLAVITGLTAASETVSFTAVIARTPILNWLDMLGRRPPAQAPQPPAAPDGPDGPPASGLAGPVAARPGAGRGRTASGGNAEDGPGGQDGPLTQRGPVTGDGPATQRGPVTGDGPATQRGPVTGDGPATQRGPVIGDGPATQHSPVIPRQRRGPGAEPPASA